jgi:hypothetical protein
MARVRSRQLYLASEHVFTQLDSEPMLTHEQVVRIAHEFFRTYLDDVEKTRLHQGAIKDSQREALAAIHDKRAERVRMDLGLNDTLFAIESTEQILRKLQLTGLSDEEREQARHVVMRAGLDACQAAAAIYRGDFNYEPKDALLKQAFAAPPTAQPSSNAAPDQAVAPAPPSNPSPMFEKAARSFSEQQRITKRWEAQTAHQSRKSYDLFSEIAGNKPLAEYVKGDAAHFKDILERLPPDYGKNAVFRGMSPQEILSEDAKRSEPIERLSSRTVKRHLTALSTLWTDAISRGTLSTNIFSGFRFSQHARAEDDRDMWETADLIQLLQRLYGPAAARRIADPRQGRSLFVMLGFGYRSSPFFLACARKKFVSSTYQISNLSKVFGFLISMKSHLVNLRTNGRSGVSQFIPSFNVSAFLPTLKPSAKGKKPAYFLN